VSTVVKEISTFRTAEKHLQLKQLEQQVVDQISMWVSLVCGTQATALNLCNVVQIQTAVFLSARLEKASCRGYISFFQLTGVC
jgi:alpha-D-ribose 1-methylphosphonate 5-triphosphate synthase subunit PhnH